jgi:ribonuclease J
VVREREMLARDGILLINLIIDRHTRQLTEEAEIITRGFIYTRDANELLANMQKLINDTVRRGNGDLQQDLQEALKSFVYNETKRRPMILVITNGA